MKIISSVLIVLAILLMTSETILQAFPKQALKTKTGIQQIALIDIYSQQIDMAVDNGKSVRKFFGEVYIENNHSEWKEFKSEEALGSVETSDSAFLFLKNSTPVLAGITFSSGSGDWSNKVNYYFRENGTLAKIDATLDTHYGDMTVKRKMYFNEIGALLSKDERFLDIKTKNPKTPPEDFYDEEPPVYRKVSDLPFFKLISKPKN